MAALLLLGVGLVSAAHLDSNSNDCKKKTGAMALMCWSLLPDYTQRSRHGKLECPCCGCTRML